MKLRNQKPSKHFVDLTHPRRANAMNDFLSIKAGAGRMPASGQRGKILAPLPPTKTHRKKAR